uniref:Alpha/beta hydrolase fold-3 domain-containing protein n=1 Tax=Oryza meridionalis TaxID=40149 RepID=A0A0E0C9V1_9ORYZ
MELSASFLMGDSVGDNIAHHVSQRWTMRTASTLPPPSDIAGMVLLEPYFGGEERTKPERALEGVSLVVNIRRGLTGTTPWPAHVTSDARLEPELQEAFPVAMLIVGGLDPLQDWDWRYAGMLRQKVVRVVEFLELAADIRKLVEEISSPAPSSRAKQRGARRDKRRRGQSCHFEIPFPLFSPEIIK